MGTARAKVLWWEQAGNVRIGTGAGASGGKAGGKPALRGSHEQLGFDAVRWKPLAGFGRFVT